MAAEDVCFIDPEPMHTVPLQGVAKRLGLEYCTFEWADEALAYIKGLPDNELPQAYFIDTGRPSEPEEMARRPEIFAELKKRGRTNHCYFLTVEGNETSPFPAEFQPFYAQQKERLIDKMESKRIFGLLEQIAQEKTRP